jgi:hypothetical protein
LQRRLRASLRPIWPPITITLGDEFSRLPAAQDRPNDAAEQRLCGPAFPDWHLLQFPALQGCSARDRQEHGHCHATGIDSAHVRAEYSDFNGGLVATGSPSSLNSHCFDLATLNHLFAWIFDVRKRA